MIVQSPSCEANSHLPASHEPHLKRTTPTKVRPALPLVSRPLGLRYALDLVGLVQSLSPCQPRTWCSAYLTVSLGVSAVPISPQALG